MREEKQTLVLMRGEEKTDKTKNITIKKQHTVVMMMAPVLSRI